MYRVPPESPILIDSWTLLNKLGAASIYTAGRMGGFSGGVYCGLLGLITRQPVIGVAGVVLGLTAGAVGGALLGMLNGFICGLITIRWFRPLRSPHAHRARMMAVSAAVLGAGALAGGLMLMVFGHRLLESNLPLILVAGILIPALLAALDGLYVGAALTTWYQRQIESERRISPFGARPQLFLGAQMADQGEGREQP